MGKDKSYFDNASLIDSDSFQVSCCFPNLLNIYVPLIILEQNYGNPKEGPVESETLEN